MSRLHKMKQSYDNWNEHQKWWSETLWLKPSKLQLQSLKTPNQSNNQKHLIKIITKKT